MKVFFIIGNLYVYRSPYERIAREMTGRGATAEFYYIGEREGFRHSEAGEARQMPVFYLNTRPGAVNRAAQFLMLAANRLRLRRFFRREMPGVVVIGGDIANMNTRLALECCREMRMPVVMVPLAVPGMKIANPDPYKGIPAAGLVRRALGLIGLERAVFFNNWVLGSYHAEGAIALPDERSRRMLIENGIAPERLVVTGDPLQDMIAEVSARPLDDVRLEVRVSLGLPSGCRMVLYCTEMIQTVYGTVYASRIHRMVRDAFERLPDDAFLLVKPHPREAEESLGELAGLFDGRRYRVMEGVIDNLLLLRASDLVIAHYSSMLNTAGLLGAPVLSIRLVDDENPVVFGNVYAATHVTREEDLGPKVRGLLNDSALRAENLAIAEGWRSDAGVAVDGLAAERIAALALEHMGAAR